MVAIIPGERLPDQPEFVKMKHQQEYEMFATIQEFDDFTRSKEFQNIPFEVAMSSDRIFWHQKIEDVASIGGDLAMWEIAHSLNMFFDTYPDHKVSIEMRWNVQSDRGHSYIDAVMNLNEAYYHPDMADDVEESLLDYFSEIDDEEMLKSLYYTMEGAVSANFTGECDRFNALFEGKISSKEDVARIMEKINPDVVGRINALIQSKALLENTPLPQQASRPSPRF